MAGLERVDYPVNVQFKKQDAINDKRMLALFPKTKPENITFQQTGEKQSQTLDAWYIEQNKHNKSVDDTLTYILAILNELNGKVSSMRYTDDIDIFHITERKINETLLRSNTTRVEFFDFPTGESKKYKED